MHLKTTLLILSFFFLIGAGCRRQVSESDSINQESAQAETTGNHSTETDASSDEKGRSQTAVVARPMPKTAAELKAVRAEQDEKTWSDEVRAQKHEETFVELWDALIHGDDKYGVLKNFAFNDFVVGTEASSETLDWEIQKTRFDGPHQTISFEQWPSWVSKFEQAGYEIVETEFHHSQFEPSELGATSKVSFLIHAKREDKNERFIVRGNLKVKWQSQPDATTGRFVPDTIDATDVFVMSRAGDPAFAEVRLDRFPTDSRGEKYPTTIHPIIIQDLNEDGLP
ncbi:MAG: hypothetical protein KDB27_30970, partial [Planctomycetales bacterium]|nr:hypothetical protein [Planctomycetales bacterium]